MRLYPFNEIKILPVRQQRTFREYPENKVIYARLVDWDVATKSDKIFFGFHQNHLFFETRLFHFIIDFLSKKNFDTNIGTG